MAAEDRSNGAWSGELESHCSTFIASSFRESADKRLGGPGNMKVHGSRRCANVLNSQ